MIARTPVILQRESPECGLACVAILLEYHGIEIELEDLRTRVGLSNRGCTVEELVAVARTHGLALEPTSLGLEQLATETPPYIIHVRFDHFNVVEGVSHRGLYVNDPMIGQHRLPWQSVNDGFTGIALRPAGVHRDARRSARRSWWPRCRAILGHFVTDAVLAAAAIAILAVWAIGEGWSGPSSVLFVVAVYLLIHSVRAVRGLAFVRLSGAFPRRMLGGLASCHPRAKTLRSPKALTEGVLSAPLIEERLLSADAPSLACAALSLYFLAASAGGALNFIPPALTVFAATMLQLRLLDPAWARNFRNERRPDIFSSALLRDIWRFHGSGFELDSVYKTADSCALLQYRIHAAQRATALAGAAGHAAILLFFLLACAIARRWEAVAHAAIVSYGLLNLAGVRRIVLEAIDLLDAGREFGTVRPAARAAPQMPALAEDVVLAIESVQFSHRPDGAPIVDLAAFRLGRGEHVFLRSGPGGGRSTLLKLMSGRLSGHEGLAGTILHNEKHGPLILVDDKPIIFDGTLRRNLALGRRLDDAELWAALRLVELRDELIGRGGLAMILTGFAPALSGGQLGRLSLAQAVLERPSALLLDNVLDGIPLDQERRILARIKAMGLAVVACGSRPAGSAGYDRIIALANGGLHARHQ